MLVLVLVLAVVVLLLLLLQLQLLRWWLLRWGWGGIPYLRDLPAQGSAWVRTQEGTENEASTPGFRARLQNLRWRGRTLAQARSRLPIGSRLLVPDLRAVVHKARAHAVWVRLQPGGVGVVSFLLRVELLPKASHLCREWLLRPLPSKSSALALLV